MLNMASDSYVHIPMYLCFWCISNHLYYCQSLCSMLCYSFSRNIILTLGQSYDWLNASSNTTMVTVDNTVGITASFFHLPHGGISVIIDGNVSNDGDMDCSKNSGIMNKIVNYTCISLQPSVNKVIAQLSFCSIEFTSHPLNITIGIQSGKYNYIPQYDLNVFMPYCLLLCNVKILM